MCPRILWDLAISDFLITWLSTCLEATATSYLKRWSGLAKSATLQGPKDKGGLELPSVTGLYRKIQVNNACQLLAPQDPVIRHVATLRTQKEENQKRTSFLLMTEAREALAVDPRASKSADDEGKEDSQKRRRQPRS